MAILQQVGGKVLFSIPDEQLEQYSIPAEKLAETLKDTGIRVGVKASAEEIGSAPVQKLQAMSVQTSQASASYLRVNIAICPHCGASNRLIEDTQVYRWFSCATCGGSFRF